MSFSFIMPPLHLLSMPFAFIMPPFHLLPMPFSFITPPLHLLSMPFSFITPPFHLLPMSFSFTTPPLHLLSMPFSFIMKPLHLSAGSTWGACLFGLDPTRGCSAVVPRYEYNNIVYRLDLKRVLRPDHRPRPTASAVAKPTL